MAKSTNQSDTTYTDPEQFLLDAMNGKLGFADKQYLRESAAKALLGAKLKREQMNSYKKTNGLGKKDAYKQGAKEILESGRWAEIIAQSKRDAGH